MLLRTLLALCAILCCNAALAGLKEGYAALARKDYVTAMKEYRPLAERGNAEAQYRVGRMYEFGQGVPQDKALGIAWVRKAAEQNHADAQYELGVVYGTGDGVKQDDVQAVAWFRKAAMQGDSMAQYNLGQSYANGQGVNKDYAQAVDWWRKSAAQGNADAQFKLGVVYYTGQGVEKDPVLALANATIAARSGDKEKVAFRDDLAKDATAEQRRSAKLLADAWKVGQPLPGSTAASGSAPKAAVASSAPVKTRCSATGSMSGEKFTANNCVASLYGDQHSVAIFMFCPGGGKEAAAASAVKSIDLNTNHAKSPMAGIQRVVEAPRDFKVEKMTGEIKPGGTLSGRIVGSLDKTAFTFDFELSLPTKDAAAGMSCGK